MLFFPVYTNAIELPSCIVSSTAVETFKDSSDRQHHIQWKPQGTAQPWLFSVKSHNLYYVPVMVVVSIYSYGIALLVLSEILQFHPWKSHDFQKGFSPRKY